MAYVVADVRALSAGQYQHIIVYGSTALSDGGGGFYTWNASSTDTDDGALWIKPDSVAGGSPGRWQRVWAPPDDVTLAGAGYLSISGQQITAGSIDLATQTTGILPATQSPIRATVTETGTTRTNVATDAQAWVRFTNTGAKTPTVSDAVAAAGDVWIWYNAAATGKMTIAAGGGVTLTGNLVFDPLRGAMIRFQSASAADVLGGTAT